MAAEPATPDAARTAPGEPVSIRFFLPDPALAPFISTYYLTEVAVPDDGWVEDWLHPEWGNLRFGDCDGWDGAIGAADLATMPRFCVSGPSCQATRFRNRTMRSWGVGLLPLGWARLIDARADHHADRLCDGALEPAFAGFAPLLAALFDADHDDCTCEAAAIDAFLLAILRQRPTHDDEPRIKAAHAALLDPTVGSVAALAARIGMSARSLERLSLRAFGFPPKLLLRRQRFLRSLARFMLDPSVSWLDTLDPGYVDQAHFVRDFRRFMGMGPSAYAAIDHPVAHAAARARAKLTGHAMQVLHPA